MHTKDTNCAEYRGKHHPTTKTHNCSPVENPSTFIDFSATATRSSFGSCFIREFFYAALMRPCLLKSRRVMSLCSVKKAEREQGSQGPHKQRLLENY